MRILTVRQPWAWAIIYGQKDVENRSRNIVGSYRGPVAIHVSKTLVPPGDAWWQAAKAGMDTAAVKEDLDLGHIIGTVEIVDVHRHSDLLGCYRPADVLGWVPWDGSDASTPGWEPRACSPWAIVDNHHIVLANPQPFAEPIPAKGKLGLWNWEGA